MHVHAFIFYSKELALVGDKLADADHVTKDTSLYSCSRLVASHALVSIPSPFSVPFPFSHPTRL